MQSISATPPQVPWNPGPLGRPAYAALADAIERDIAAGRLRPGDRLPPQRQLADLLAVNVVTVGRGYTEAARRGLVGGEVGRGTYVLGSARSSAPLTAPRPSGAPAPEVVDLRRSNPQGGLQWLDVPAALAALAPKDLQRLLASGYEPLGLPHHRAAGAAWLARSGAPAAAERTVVCGGAQQALTAVLSALTRPGDLLLTAELCYTGAQAVAKVLGLRHEGLALDAQGLRPEAFEEQCRRRRPVALYLTPTIHNPTGSVLPLERRAALAAIAREHGVAIVEDLTYGELCPEPPPPVASLAPERTYLLTSTAKCLATGLRVGFLGLPEEGGGGALERIRANVEAVGWTAAPLLAELVARWIADGTAERVVAAKRAEIRQRRELFDAELGAAASPSDPRSPLAWLPLPEPWRAREFERAARAAGVELSSAEDFAVGRAAAPHAVRLCLTTPPEDDTVRRGLAVLAELLRSGPSAGAALV
jgi:DNA-binding transcriptional MocR family regulator